MTKYPDLFANLAAPFESSQVRTRSQGGKSFSYVTARTIMNRLDDVLGPEDWWPVYTPGENSVQCAITIRLPDGSLLTKADAGGYAGMSDSGDDDKSGYSDGLKRAAAVFGVGRYLYGEGVPQFAAGLVHDPRGEMREQSRENGYQQDRSQQSQPDRDNGNGNGHSGPPRTGRAMFAWTKAAEQKHGVDLLKYLNGYAKMNDLPARLVDWSAEQVAQGYAEANRKLQSLQSLQVPDDGTYEEALGN